MTDDEKLDVLATNEVRQRRFARFAAIVTYALEEAYSSGFCERELFLLLIAAIENFDTLNRANGKPSELCEVLRCFGEH